MFICGYLCMCMYLYLYVLMYVCVCAHTCVYVYMYMCGMHVQCMCGMCILSYMCNKAQISLSPSGSYPTVIIRNSSLIFPSGPSTFSIFYSEIMISLGIHLNMSSEKRHSFLSQSLASRNNTHMERIFLPAGLKCLFYHMLISYGSFVHF